MARFFAAVIMLSALVCTSLSMPQNSPNKEEVQESTLVLLPSESDSGDLKFFFFPFNFWNGFRPLPWIPLPGLIPTTAAPEGTDEDKGDDKEDKEEENKDEDKTDDNEEKDKEDEKEENEKAEE